MAGQASDIRAGGAFIELYLKGDKQVMAGLDLLASRADRFTLVLGTMGKASRVAFSQVATASRLMGSAVTKSIGIAIKAVKALNAQMAALLISSRRVLPGIASAFSKFGKQMMMFGSFGAIGAGFSTTTFAKFEAGMSKVQAITGASAEKMKELKDQAKELGRTTFFTASQVSEAQKFLAMAGFDPDQILKAVPQVLDLALAGDMDLGTAADIATNISTPFKIAAEDLGRVNDILAKAATSSNTNVEEMGQAFKYVAPIAAKTGQSLEEMGAAMAILANNGIKADQAGTGLRKTITTLAKSGMQEKLKKQYGINIKDSFGNIRPVLDVLREMDSALRRTGHDGTDIVSELFGDFGDRAGTAATILLDSGEAADVFRKKMNNAAGTTGKIAQTMADNLKGSWIALMSAVEGAQIAFGEAVAPMLRKAFDETTKLIRTFSEWLTKNKEIAVSFAVITAGIVVTGGAIALLGGALATVSTILTPLTIAATGLMIGVGAAVTAAIGMIGTALTATVTAVAAIPAMITAVVTAISVLGGAVFAVLSSAVSAIIGIPAMISGVVMVVSGAISAVYSFVGIVAAGIHATVLASMAGISAIVAGGSVAIGSLLAAISLAIPFALIAMSALSAALIWAGKKISNVFSDIFSGIKQTILSIRSTVVAAARGILSAVSGIASSIGKAFLGAFGAIGKGFGVIAGAVSKNIDAIRTKIGGLMTEASKAGKELYESFSLVMKLLTKGDFESAMAIVWKEVQLRISDAKILVMTAVKTLIGNLPKIVSVLGEAFSVIVSELKNVFATLMDSVRRQINYVVAILEETIVNLKIAAIELGTFGSYFLKEKNKEHFKNRKKEMSEKTEEARKAALPQNQDNHEQETSSSDSIRTKINAADIFGGFDAEIEKELDKNKGLRTERDAENQKQKSKLGIQDKTDKYTPWAMSQDRAKSEREIELEKFISLYDSTEDKRSLGNSAYFRYTGAKKELTAIQNIRSKQGKNDAKRAEYEAKIEARRNGTALPDKIDKAQAGIRKVAATDYVAQITGALSKGTFSAFEAASGFSNENSMVGELENHTRLLRNIDTNTKGFTVVGE